VGGQPPALTHAVKPTAPAGRPGREVTPVADRADDGARLGVSISQRLAAINRRLAELREARQAERHPATPPLDVLWEAQRHAAEAERHRRESIAHSLLVRQLVVQAFHNAARAHDHAAEANERSARSGIGDVAEHKRRARFHRAAAEADRQRARQAASEDEPAEPAVSAETAETAEAAEAP
jgi:hypothetical protein